MIHFKNWKLMAAADDDKGGGGGEDIASIVAAAVAAALPKALNGAITAHLKRVEAKFEERVSKLEKPAAAPGEGDEGDEPAAGGEPVKGGKPGALPSEVEQRILRAEKRAEKLEREVKAEREARAAEEAKRLTNEERSALSKVLGEKKVSPEMLDVAVALLHTEQKRVARGEGGKLSWRGDDGDELGLTEGVDAFLKTPTGQRFLPATGAGGGGSGPGGKPPGAAGGDAFAGQSILGMMGQITTRG